jgi:hypothetical protein
MTFVRLVPVVKILTRRSVCLRSDLSTLLRSLTLATLAATSGGCGQPRRLGGQTHFGATLRSSVRQQETDRYHCTLEIRLPTLRGVHTNDRPGDLDGRQLITISLTTTPEAATSALDLVRVWVSIQSCRGAGESHRYRASNPRDAARVNEPAKAP